MARKKKPPPAVIIYDPRKATAVDLADIVARLKASTPT
jgi:hypothetical protein